MEENNEMGAPIVEKKKEKKPRTQAQLDAFNRNKQIRLEKLEIKKREQEAGKIAIEEQRHHELLLKIEQHLTPKLLQSIDHRFDHLKKSVTQPVLPPPAHFGVPKLPQKINLQEYNPNHEDDEDYIINRNGQNPYARPPYSSSQEYYPKEEKKQKTTKFEDFQWL
jgi:hypothetical protein